MLQVCPMLVTTELYTRLQEARIATRKFHVAENLDATAALTADKAIEMSKLIYSFDSLRQALHGLISPHVIRTLENVALALVL